MIDGQSNIWRSTFFIKKTPSVPVNKMCHRTCIFHELSIHNSFSYVLISYVLIIVLTH